MGLKIKIQLNNILNIIEKKENIKRNKQNPIDLKKYFYQIKISKINSKQQYIIDILKILSYSNNQINITNKNHQIFFLKFLENSIKILENKLCEDSPGIIINSKDLEILGKDKDLILQYIELSLLYENEALKLFFCFLNKNIDLLRFKFLEIKDSDDITNINQLQKIYKFTLDILKDSKKNKKIKISNKKQIIIIEDKIKEQFAKEKKNIKEHIKIKEKSCSLIIKDDKSIGKNLINIVNNNNKTCNIITIDKNKKELTIAQSDDRTLIEKKIQNILKEELLKLK